MYLSICHFPFIHLLMDTCIVSMSSNLVFLILVFHIRGPQPPGHRLELVQGLLGTRLHSRKWVVGKWVKHHLCLQPLLTHCSHYHQLQLLSDQQQQQQQQQQHWILIGTQTLNVMHVSYPQTIPHPGPRKNHPQQNWSPVPKMLWIPNKLTSFVKSVYLQGILIFISSSLNL